MSTAVGETESLKFRLDVEDEWPPVGVESLPFRKADPGFEALVAPLFVKNLSVGDVIDVQLDEEGLVDSWRHLATSAHTTIWLLRLKKTTAIDEALTELRALGCNSVGLDSSGCYAVDVPPAVAISDVDLILSELDETAVATAYPSMRHPE